MHSVLELHFRWSPPRSACSAIRSVDGSVQRISDAELLCGIAPSALALSAIAPQ
jgi:hypothetical protein